MFVIVLLLLIQILLNLYIRRLERNCFKVLQCFTMIHLGRGSHIKLIICSEKIFNFLFLRKDLDAGDIFHHYISISLHSIIFCLIMEFVI